MFATGCVNMYIRCPFTQSKIVDTYQSTRSAAGISLIVMFPQTMGYGNDRGFIAENIFTIPLGCIGMCDVLLEGCVDTVLYPCDYVISKTRKGTKDRR